MDANEAEARWSDDKGSGWRNLGSEPTVPGLRVEQTFNVQLGHQLKPGDGQEAPSQALQDLQLAWKYISANGTTLTTEGAIIFSPASHTYDGGGAFVITSFQLRVTYEMSLAI